MGRRSRRSRRSEGDTKQSKRSRRAKKEDSSSVAVEEANDMDSSGSRRASRRGRQGRSRAEYPQRRSRVPFVLGFLGLLLVLAIVFFKPAKALYHVRQLRVPNEDTAEMAIRSLAQMRMTGANMLMDVIREYEVDQEGYAEPAMVRNRAARAFGSIAAYWPPTQVGDEEIVYPLASIAIGEKFVPAGETDEVKDAEEDAEEEGERLWDVPEPHRHNAVYGLGFTKRASAGEALALILDPSVKGDPVKQEMAARAAGRVPYASGIQACLLGLQNPEPRVREASLRSIVRSARDAGRSELSAPPAIGLILESFSHDDPNVQEGAQQALEAIAESAEAKHVMPYLVQETDEDGQELYGWETRRKAVEMLSHIGQQDMAPGAEDDGRNDRLTAMNAIRDVMEKDTNWHVRLAAIEALTALEATEYAQDVRDRLEKDAQPEVRLLVAELMAREPWRHPLGAAALTALLRRSSEQDNKEPPQIIKAALYSLASLLLDDSKAVDAEDSTLGQLRQVLRDMQGFEQVQQNPEIQTAVQQLLTRIEGMGASGAAPSGQEAGLPAQ